VGTGWAIALRSALRLPVAVNPLEPQVLALTGIDPAAQAWVALRPLRGGVHLRAALALTEPRVAEALVRTLGSALKIELTSGAPGTWQGLFPSGEPLLVRLDGDVLVVDWVLPGSASPTAGDLARIIPLRPPRAWKAGKGASRLLRGDDAFDVWIDLAQAATMSVSASERAAVTALHSVDPAHKAALQRSARAEMLTCRHRLDEPASFDEVAMAIAARDERHAQLTIALATKSQAPAPRATSVPSFPDSLVRDVELDVASWPADWTAEAAELPKTCGPWSRLDWALRRWPRLLAGSEAALLSSTRGAALAFPHADKKAPLASSQLIGLVRFDPRAQSGLAAWVDKSARALGIEATLREALAPDDPWLLLMLGTPKLLNGALHDRIPNAAPQAWAAEVIASFHASATGIARLFAAEPDVVGLFDEVEQLTGDLGRDGALLRLEAELALRPSAEKSR
jgi:hypothetical protein